MEDFLGIIGIFGILAMMFIAGRCSLDESWENACKKNRPVIIENEIYRCRKASPHE